MACITSFADRHIYDNQVFIHTYKTMCNLRRLRQKYYVGVYDNYDTVHNNKQRTNTKIRSN